MGKLTEREHTYSREAAVFTRPGQVAKMCLPDGFRFVCLVNDTQPQAFPINEPGMWEVDIPAMLAKGKYPVVVVTVDAAHVAAFEAMPAKVVNEMLAALARTQNTPDSQRGDNANER